MSRVRYCRRCITPATRPQIALDAGGVCNACRAHAARPSIDWAARAAAFRDVAAAARARSRGYDCVVPVSGGKDSTWQVVTCLEHGLTPLAVTWKAPSRTAIGARNLANLVGLGVDHVDYQISPVVERKFLAASFARHGTTALPMHMALFAIPLRIAAAFRIPLVVWGENPATEYGGPPDAQRGFRMDDRWLRTYGVTHGTTARDWISPELTERELTAYVAPTEAELDAAGVLAVFLGHYFAWDPERSLAVARAHGFASRAEGPRTGHYDYADIDDDFISIHHWLKWYKFVFTRTFDNLSLEIRNGRLTRAQAVEIVRRRGDETPREDIDAFCAFVGMARRRFAEIAESFRNPAVWTRRDGVWVIDGFLVPDWKWTEGELLG
jgi:N-acetyl sugar amidotransferase